MGERHGNTNVRARGGGGGKTLLLTLALLTLAAVAALLAADFTPPVQAQSEDETTGRIVARQLDDGRVEFGWQPTGGARVLPRQRYFPAPADATVDRWLRSSPVEVGGVEIGRINARLWSSGRIEFAFTPTDGERIAPPARYFPADARAGRWLRSTEIAIGRAALRYVAVSAGESNTCAIREANGAIECWGANGHYYRYAVGTPYRETGQSDAPDGSYIAVSTGMGHTCAIRQSDGRIVCWGENFAGKSIPPDGSFIAVSAGRERTCAIRTSGELACWGEQHYSDDRYVDVNHLAADSRYTAISVGDSHTCAIREATGAIECWGANFQGQTDAPDGRFTAVSAGNNTTCALRDTGKVACWPFAGYEPPAGSFAAIGTRYADNNTNCALRESGAITCWGFDNSSGQANAPTGRYTAVSAGYQHTCAIRESDNAIECWGKNSDGQATPPNGQRIKIATPRFTAVSARAHTCAIRESGEIACWGYNESGQTDAPEGSYTAVSAGGRHTCGLRTSGEIACWGYNGYGQSDAPAGSFSAVSVGGYHRCAIRNTGEIACWGANSYGQSDAPDGAFAAVSAGSEHTCAIRKSGEVACWGLNDAGQTDALEGSFTAVSAGTEHTCGLRENGTIECWGQHRIPYVPAR